MKTIKKLMLFTLITARVFAAESDAAGAPTTKSAIARFWDSQLEANDETIYYYTFPTPHQRRQAHADLFLHNLKAEADSFRSQAKSTILTARCATDDDLKREGLTRVTHQTMTEATIQHLNQKADEIEAMLARRLKTASGAPYNAADLTRETVEKMGEKNFTTMIDRETEALQIETQEREKQTRVEAHTLKTPGLKTLITEQIQETVGIDPARNPQEIDEQIQASMALIQAAKSAARAKRSQEARRAQEARSTQDAKNAARAKNAAIARNIARDAARMAELD